MPLLPFCPELSGQAFKIKSFLLWVRRGNWRESVLRFTFWMNSGSRLPPAIDPAGQHLSIRRLPQPQLTVGNFSLGAFHHVLDEILEHGRRQARGVGVGQHEKRLLA